MTKPKDPGNVVQLVIGGEVPAPAPELPLEDEPRHGIPLRDDGLPNGCPVVPLGVSGEISYYLDALGQLRGLNAQQHGRLHLNHLFGDQWRLLSTYWPRFARGGRVDGFKPELASTMLMGACAHLGLWDPFERVRGAGAWLAGDGNLLLHCGDQILVPERDVTGVVTHTWRDPGRFDRYVYPASPEIPGPCDGAAPTKAGADLLALLNRWHWQRGELDARLLLGWIAAAFMGGALAWRPLLWITGDRATGKSTLQELLRLIFDQALISCSDTTGAGVWQKLGYKTVPVAIDELEAEADPRKVDNVMTLARQASSGGVVLRGGADHQGHEFKARSCFLFSSILIPPLRGADLSRLAILELNPLGDRVPPALDPQALALVGEQLRRRCVDHWPRLAGLIEQWRAHLMALGHKGRAADQFGTLLAAGELLLSDHPPSSEELTLWDPLLSAAVLQETSDNNADHDRCLAHLLTSRVDVFRGGKQTPLANWIDIALGRRSHSPVEIAEANEVLDLYGLKIVQKPYDDTAIATWLAVANAHQGLAGVFSGTHWGGRSGTSGVWSQALRRVANARAAGPYRFSGANARCVLLPVDEILPKGSTS